MSIFEYVIVVVMLILGIGITQLLGDVVDAFRSRNKIRMHWLPLAWTGVVFAHQIQFIWAIFELQTVHPKVWPMSHFLATILMALLLFLAGSLVVPQRNDENESALTQFQHDGRWTLIILSAYYVMAFCLNILFFKMPLFEVLNFKNAFLAGLLVLIVFVRRAWFWNVGTVAFFVLSLSALFLVSPGQY